MNLQITGHGSSKPAAFFISDGPNGQDFENGQSLTGYAGNVLRDFCKEQGLYLDDFWRTCLIKEKLPEHDDKEGTKTKALIEQYSPILIHEINDLNPFLLIPLGELSFNYLTNLSNIRKFRGSILSPSGSFQLTPENLKVLPILGPYPYINQDYKLRVISRIDFAKIPKYLNKNPIPDSIYNIWVARTSTAFRAFFRSSL